MLQSSENPTTEPVITHRMRRPSARQEPTPEPVSSPPGPLSAIEQRGTKVRARRRQQLISPGGAPETVFVVRSGLLVLQTLPPDQPRQLLTLLYPQDIFAPSFAPALPGAVLSAVSPSELWRLPSRTFEALLAEESRSRSTSTRGSPTSTRAASCTARSSAASTARSAWRRF